MSSEKGSVAGKNDVRKINHFIEFVNNFGILIQTCSNLYAEIYDWR